MLPEVAACQSSNLPLSGKKSWQNVGNEVHQAVADHVGHQITTPQIKSRQDYTCRERDQNICCAS
jgi:hypothetical protein